MASRALASASVLAWPPPTSSGRGFQFSTSLSKLLIFSILSLIMSRRGVSSWAYSYLLWIEDLYRVFDFADFFILQIVLLL
jgi:hypothetical protein